MSIEMGTVSHGTMREEDLIPTFMAFLDCHAPAEAQKVRDEFGPAFVMRCGVAGALEYPTQGETSNREWLMEMLWEAMEAIAPEGSYFSAIEGDGSDYGFWPNDSEGED